MSNGACQAALPPPSSLLKPALPPTRTATGPQRGSANQRLCCAADQGAGPQAQGQSHRRRPLGHSLRRVPTVQHGGGATAGVQKGKQCPWAACGSAQACALPGRCPGTHLPLPPSLQALPPTSWWTGSTLETSTCCTRWGRMPWPCLESSGATLRSLPGAPFTLGCCGVLYFLTNCACWPPPRCSNGKMVNGNLELHRWAGMVGVSVVLGVRSCWRSVAEAGGIPLLHAHSCCFIFVQGPGRQDAVHRHIDRRGRPRVPVRRSRSQWGQHPGVHGLLECQGERGSGHAAPRL